MDPRLIGQIRIELEARGVPATAKNIRAMAAEIDALIKKDQKLGQDYNRLIGIISNLADGHSEAFRKMNTAMQSHDAALAGLEKAYGKLDKTVKSALTAVIGFASFDGLISAVQKSMGLYKQYNNQLIEVTGSVKRLGVGMAEMEQRMDRSARNFNMTLQETMGLFKQYEASFNGTTFTGFERVMKNIQKVTGANAQATQEWMQKLSGLIAKMPDLQVSFERMNESDKERINLAAQRLAVIGQLSSAEMRQIQNYLHGASQVSNADRMRERQARETQKTFQEFARHAERIGLMLANAMMPAFTEIANWLSQNEGTVRSFFDTMASFVKIAVSHVKELTIALGALIGLWASGKVFGFAGQALTGLRTAVNVARTGMGFLGMGSAGAGGAGAGGGAAGGAALGLGARIGSAARLGGSGMALGFAASGLDMAKNWQEAEGNHKTAGALGVGSAIATTGSYALTGAAMGSLFGPPGMALGALAGVVIGVTTNFDKLVASGKKLLGLNEEELKQQGKLDAATERGKANAQKFLQSGGSERSDQIEAREREASEKATQQEVDQIMSGGATAEGFINSQNRLAAAQKKQKQAEANLGGELASKTRTVSGKTFNATESKDNGIAALQNLHEQTVGRINQNSSELANGASGDRKKELEGELETLRAQAKEQTKMLQELDEEAEKVKKGNALYREANLELKKEQAIHQAQNDLLNRQQEVLQLIKQQVGATTGVFDTLITYAQQIGGVTEDQARGALQEVVQANEEARQKMLALQNLQEQINKGETRSADANQMIADIMKKQGVAKMDEIRWDIVHKETRQQVYGTELAINAARKKMTEMQQGELNLVSAQAQKMQNLVTLADNFATGVGASAQMRLQSVQAMDKEIAVLQQMASETDRQIAEDKANGKDSLALQQRRLDLDNQILQKQTAQAQQMRQLRDGWISALGAMNTGAGRFTKIMISQEQALSAGVGRFKSVISNTSGTIRNAGSSVNERTGYTTSAKFSGFSEGGINPNQGGIGSGQFAYLTGQTGEFDLNTMEAVMRGKAAAAGAAVQGKAQAAAAAGATTGQSALEQAQGSGVGPMSQRRGVTTSNQFYGNGAGLPRTPATNGAPGAASGQAGGIPNTTGPVPFGQISTSTGRSDVQTMYVANLVVQGGFSGFNATSVASAIPQQQANTAGSAFAKPQGAVAPTSAPSQTTQMVSQATQMAGTAEDTKLQETRKQFQNSVNKHLGDFKLEDLDSRIAKSPAMQKAIEARERAQRVTEEEPASSSYFRNAANSRFHENKQEATKEEMTARIEAATEFARAAGLSGNLRAQEKALAALEKQEELLQKGMVPESQLKKQQDAYQNASKVAGDKQEEFTLANKDKYRLGVLGAFTGVDKRTRLAREAAAIANEEMVARGNELKTTEENQEQRKQAKAKIKQEKDALRLRYEETKAQFEQSQGNLEKQEEEAKTRRTQSFAIAANEPLMKQTNDRYQQYVNTEASKYFAETESSQKAANAINSEASQLSKRLVGEDPKRRKELLGKASSDKVREIAEKQANILEESQKYEKAVGLQTDIAAYTEMNGKPELIAAKKKQYEEYMRKSGLDEEEVTRRAEMSRKEREKETQDRLAETGVRSNQGEFVAPNQEEFRKKDFQRHAYNRALLEVFQGNMSMFARTAENNPEMDDNGRLKTTRHLTKEEEKRVQEFQSKFVKQQEYNYGVAEGTKKQQEQATADAKKQQDMATMQNALAAMGYTPAFANVATSVNNPPANIVQSNRPPANVNTTPGIAGPTATPQAQSDAVAAPAAVSSAGKGGASGTASISLNYAIPSVAVQVSFDNLDQLADIIKQKIQSELGESEANRSNFGNQSGKDRVTV